LERRLEKKRGSAPRKILISMKDSQRKEHRTEGSVGERRDTGMTVWEPVRTWSGEKGNGIRGEGSRPWDCSTKLSGSDSLKGGEGGGKGNLLKRGKTSVEGIDITLYEHVVIVSSRATVFLRRNEVQEERRAGENCFGRGLTVCLKGRRAATKTNEGGW